MNPDKRKKVLLYIVVAIILIALSFTIVNSHSVPKREFINIVSKENQFHNDFLNASAISVSLKPQGFTGALYSIDYVPLEHSITGSFVVLQAVAPSGSPMHINFYNDSSFTDPIATNVSNTFTVYIVSNSTSNVLTMFNSNYVAASLLDSNFGGMASASINPPLITYPAYSPGSFYAKFKDYIPTSKGLFSTGEFTLNLNGGSPGYGFQMGMNTTISYPLLDTGNNPFLASAPYLQVSNYGSIEMMIQGAGYFPVSLANISGITLTSNSPPYCQITLNSNSTYVYANDGSQKIVGGNTAITSVGDSTITFNMANNGWYVEIASPNSLISHEGTYLFTESVPVFSSYVREIASILLGSAITIFIANPMSRRFNWL